METAERSLRTAFLLVLGLVVLGATLWIASRRTGPVVDPGAKIEQDDDEGAIGKQANPDRSDTAASRRPVPQTGDAAEAVPPGLIINLSILDADEAPVEGSHVKVTANGQVFEGTSDSKGIYSFRLLPGEGSGMTVAVDAEGFVHVRRRFFSKASTKIRLSRAATLRGLLIDKLGHAPMAGVRVRYKHYLCQDCEPETATSDAGGGFSLATLPRGVSLHLELSGKDIPIQIADVVIPKDEAVHREQIEVSRGIQLRGVVVDHTKGHPLEGVEFRSPPPWKWLLDKTDASGRFAIRILPRPLTQKVEIWVLMEGYCRLRSHFGASVAERITELRIPLPRSCSVEGVMRDREGKPLAGGVVYANRYHGKQRSQHATPDPGHAFDELRKLWTLEQIKSIRSARTDEQGHFLADGLLPLQRDRYELDVGCKGHRPTRILVPETAEPGGRTRIDIVLESIGPTARIHGSVTLNGKPHSAKLQWKGHSRSGPVSIGDDGRYDCEVEAGELRLSCALYGRRGGSPIAELGRTVQVPAGGRLRVDFAIRQSMAVIRGKVTREGGQPVADKRLRVDCQKSSWLMARTDEQGRYSVEVPGDAAPYVIILHHGRMPFTQTIQHPGARDVDFVLPELGVFRFRLFDVNTGDAIPTLRLYLRKAGELDYEHIERAWTLPDENGFRELRIPGGTYDFRMLSVETGHAPAIAEGVVVRAQGKPRAVEVPMRLGATLRFVLAAGQKPLPEGVLLALVSAETPDEIRVPRSSGESGRVRFGAGFHEHFLRDRVFAPGNKARDRVSRLPAGRYLIKCLAPGLGFSPNSIVVADGESRSIELSWKSVVPAKVPGGTREK